MARSPEQFTGLEIAVTGMTGRFPGAAGIDRLWTLLRNGIEPVTEFSDEELIQNGTDPALLKKPGFIRFGFVLNNIELFDAGFFGYTPGEAEILDPQQRLFLECAHEALETAGCDPQTFPGAIGVFAGTTLSSYLLNNLVPHPELLHRLGPVQLSLANDKDYLATRVAYKLNLQGPALTIQTACSTSLVAIHSACQSLLAGECDMALAGGVSINTRQKAGYIYQEGGIASRDGHCRPFDANSSGTVGGSGVGIVVLRRLEDAIENGDSIDAVILGSAINNDGSKKIGFTAPRVEGQAKAIESAQRMADVSADEIGYIEAHGTGTQLGDPIEIAALTRAFRKSSERSQYCAIGSIKSNFGHLDAAAGVAGFSKAVLALKNKQIPPSLNFRQPNPQIDFAHSPFYVNTELKAWDQSTSGRYAGVSSFGLGGTNAHVVLGEAPAKSKTDPVTDQQLLVLSARTETALDKATENLADFLNNHPEINLADVAWTLQTGRTMYEHRRIVVSDSVADAAQALGAKDPGRVLTAAGEPFDTGVVFMFSGQGSQYPNMARDLYRDFDVFRQAVDACCQHLRSSHELELLALLYPEDMDKEAAARQLKQTSIAQCALFVIEYALARLWMSWGIQPHAMIGHSIGEYVAACIAGVFDLEQALNIVATRGRLMQQQAKGAMLSVAMARDELEAMLDESLDIAAINAPQLCVVSGTEDAVDAFAAKLQKNGQQARPLHTSHGFHSYMMEPVLDALSEYIAGLTLQAPKIPYVSNVTGTWITDEQATDPQYWAKHVRSAVRFCDGVQLLLQDVAQCFIELGPGNTLSTLLRQHPDSKKATAVLNSVRHPGEQGNDTAYILNSLGRLWLAGNRPDWSQLYGEKKRHRVVLPTYPFERQAYWISAGDHQQNRKHTVSITDEHRKDIASWFYAPTWTRHTMPEQSGTEISTKGNWLVFVNNNVLAEQFITELSERGIQFDIVVPGDGFDKNQNHYTLEWNTTSDYEKLFQSLREVDRVPDKILYLWPLGETPAGDNAIDSTLQSCFYAPMALTKALAGNGIGNDITMLLATAGSFNVTGSEHNDPAAAVALGPALVMPQEYPNLHCRLVDFDAAAMREPDYAKLVRRMMAEFEQPGGDCQVAWRGDYRWTRAIEPLSVTAGGPESKGLRHNGVYLITGGLGGIGLALAEYLARTVSARLVLVARSRLPEAEQQDSWLATHADNDRTSLKIRKLRHILSYGAEVMVESADVTDPEAMQSLVTRVQQKYGAIHGVIHAAGLPSGGVIQLKTPARAADILAPKVQGACVLDTIFRDTPLDFMCLCSSLVTEFGAAGQIDYTAANAFLDAFAHYRSARGDFTFAINWDTWAEAGMAADMDVPASLREQKSQNLAGGISNEEGVAVFARALAARIPQVIISVRDPAARVARQTETLSTERSQPAPRNTAFERPKMSNDPVAPGTEIEVQLASIWCELFSIAEIGINDNFFELGGHSLLAIQIVSKIRDTLKTEITLDKFLELGTIGAIAAYLDTRDTETVKDEIVAVSEYENEREEYEL